jgi:hypothetical protein
MQDKEGYMPVGKGMDPGEEGVWLQPGVQGGPAVGEKGRRTHVKYGQMGGYFLYPDDKNPGASYVWPWESMM